MAFANTKRVIVDNTKVSGASNLTSYPMLFSGTYAGAGGDPDLRVAGSGGSIQNTDATGGISGSLTVPADFCFYAEQSLTTKLDFEIQEYDSTTGKIIAWVRIPTLKWFEDTSIYLAYNDSGVTTSQESIDATWRSEYKLVAHMVESGNGTADEYKDSSGNANHGQGNSESNGGVPDQTASGKIGNFQNFVSANQDYIGFGSAASLDDLPTGAGGMTFQAWTKGTDPGDEPFTTVAQKGNGWSHRDDYDVADLNTFTVANFNSNIGFWDSPTSGLTSDTWTLQHVIIDANSDQNVPTVYKDGSSEELTEGSDPSGTYVSDAGSSLFVGALNPDSTLDQEYNGGICEVRLYAGELSAGWVGTEHANHDSPSTFYSFSDTLTTTSTTTTMTTSSTSTTSTSTSTTSTSSSTSTTSTSSSTTSTSTSTSTTSTSSSTSTSTSTSTTSTSTSTTISGTTTSTSTTSTSSSTSTTSTSSSTSTSTTSTSTSTTSTSTSTTSTSTSSSSTTSTSISTSTTQSVTTSTSSTTSSSTSTTTTIPLSFSVEKPAR